MIAEYLLHCPELTLQAGLMDHGMPENPNGCR
jgi:hypothetical protein